TVGNTVTGSGAVVIEQVAAGTSLGIAGGLGDMQIAQSTLDRFAGLASLTLGRCDGSAAIDVGHLVLPTTLTLRSGSGTARPGGRSDGSGAVDVGHLVRLTTLPLRSGSGTVRFGGTVDSAAGFADGLSVDTTALTTFAGNVGAATALGSLALTHAARIDAAE